MTLLTQEAQEKVVSLLISEGLVSSAKVQEVVEEIKRTKQPLLATLIAKKVTDAETVTHATAVVINVPYVSLRNVMFDPEILSLLPYDVVSRSMVVPLLSKIRITTCSPQITGEIAIRRSTSFPSTSTVN